MVSISGPLRYRESSPKPQAARVENSDILMPDVNAQDRDCSRTQQHEGSMTQLDIPLTAFLQMNSIAAGGLSPSLEVELATTCDRLPEAEHGLSAMEAGVELAERAKTEMQAAHQQSLVEAANAPM
jgi:hypothetical protein